MRPSNVAFALTLVASVAAAAPTPVVVTGDPVAPSPSATGTGLCSASAVSTNIAANFPSDTNTFNGSFNAFMEANQASRVESTLDSIFDLSNNNSSGTKLSYGDFLDSEIPRCPTGGCSFVVNDTTTSFGVRFRGYLDVKPGMVGRPLHFGFYTDDAVSLTIFDRNATSYSVLIHTPQVGINAWRTTNTVTFSKGGLYPVEILYAEVSEHAAIEMSVLDGPFSDIDAAPGQPGSVNLADAGFDLFQPTQFFQTDNGLAPFANPAACVQCNRAGANLPGNNGCGSSYYCNAAALCAPCDSARFCGPTCSPCGQSSPVCVNVNGTNTCVECASNSDCAPQICDLATNTCKECNVDNDCPSGKVCDADNHVCKECHTNAQCPSGKVCDSANLTCVECNLNEDCGRGLVCDAHQCVPCSSRNSCAGNSCNCCPGGANMKCAPLAAGAMPSCVECTRDSDCTTAGTVCDTVNGRCVEHVSDCNTPDRCGDQCVRCPGDRPICLDGKVCVACRSDFECGGGNFCISGECAPCATERHCGDRCGACPSEAPFCVGNGTSAGSSCVRCRDDGDCSGGTCDPTTHQCTVGCAVTCNTGTVCNGTRCVGCYADAQCPCGGSCDLTLNVCVSSCNDSSDCPSSAHCNLNASTGATCEQGRQKPDTETRGGALCCGITGEGTPPLGGFLFVAAVSLLLRHRKTARRSR